ncbi:MAG: hypothetical protein IPK26_04995 [Planctomycetes bacterium]|nr:hypothetical protein [Planctomycetota bacterium]
MSKAIIPCDSRPRAGRLLGLVTALLVLLVATVRGQIVPVQYGDHVQGHTISLRCRPTATCSTACKATS